MLRPCLCSADSTGPSHTALDRLSRATHTHAHARAHTRAHTHMHKCTHPGPRAGSRTIFILAYKAGQQSSVSVCCMFVCVSAVVAVLQECGFCFDHCGSADWKRAFSRQEQNQSTVCSAGMAYIQSRDGVSYCTLFFKHGPSSSA